MYGPGAEGRVTGVEQGLAEDARQFRRVDERHPAEGVEHLLVGEGHISSAAKEAGSGQPAHGSVGVWEGVQWSVSVAGLVHPSPIRTAFNFSPASSATLQSQAGCEERFDTARFRHWLDAVWYVPPQD